MILLKGSLIVMVLAASILLAQTAGAQSIISRMVSPTSTPGMDNNCKRETVSVNTQNNYRADSATTLMKYYEDDKKKIQDIAKKDGVTVTIKSENYNINTSNDYQFSRDGSVSFQMSGSTSYLVEPKEKAKDFFLALTNDKIRGSMNYSMNDNCNRNQ